MSKKYYFSLFLYTLAHILLCSFLTIFCRQIVTPLGKDYLYIPYRVALQEKPAWALFGRGYHRSATSAFFEKRTRMTDLKNNVEPSAPQPVCVKKSSCCDDSLAQLMLNYASPNLGTHIFVSEPCCTLGDTIFSLKNLCNAVSYKENGIELTAQYSHPIDESKQWGMRAYLPIKKITVSVKNHHQPSKSCCSNTNNCPDIVGVKKNGQFAYRLDALSTLALTDKVDPSDGPIMQYGYIDAVHPITRELFELRVPVRNRFIYNTHLSSEDLTQVETSPHVIKNCGVPPFPFGTNDVDSFIPLSEDGNNLTTGQRGVFQPKPITYTPLKEEPLTQRTLWVVPTLTQTDEPTRSSTIVDRHIQSLLQLFTCSSLNTCSSHTAGLGDLALEGYFSCIKNKLFLELILGMTLPTGKNQDPRAVFNLPTGTNGHAQINAGYTWFRPLATWCTFFNSGKYSAVLPCTEHILASFSQPGIRNIGESENARIWWQEYLTDFTISFHESREHRYGVTFKYQFFVKEKDHTEFKSLTTNDCALQAQFDNPAIFKANTPEQLRTIAISNFFERNKKLYGNQAAHESNRIAHTLLGEFFWRITSSLNCFIQAGHTVGGKNSMRTTNFTAGLSGTF